MSKTILTTVLWTFLKEISQNCVRSCASVPWGSGFFKILCTFSTGVITFSLFFFAAKQLRLFLFFPIYFSISKCKLKISPALSFFQTSDRSKIKDEHGISWKCTLYLSDPWMDTKDQNCLNSSVGKEIFRVNSEGPRPLLACFCVIHDGLVPPAYPARANDSRYFNCTGSWAPSLLRAAIAEDMWWEPSSWTATKTILLQ